MNAIKDTFIVVNTAGIHLRPCQTIARIASSYKDCEVTGSKEGISVNAKSIMNLTELIGACGDEIAFEVTGEDAQQCLNELREAFENGFDEPIHEQFLKAAPESAEEDLA